MINISVSEMLTTCFQPELLTTCFQPISQWGALKPIEHRILLLFFTSGKNQLPLGKQLPPPPTPRSLVSWHFPYYGSCGISTRYPRKTRIIIEIRGASKVFGWPTKTMERNQQSMYILYFGRIPWLLESEMKILGVEILPGEKKNLLPCFLESSRSNDHMKQNIPRSLLDISI